MRIALIGHSAAGKTTYIYELGHELTHSNMDHGLDTNTPQSADTMIEWILNAPTPVVAVSVHREGLRKIAEIKKQGSDNRLSAIKFVYLYADKSTITHRLEKDSYRTENNINSTINEYDEMDDIFRRIADATVVTDGRSISDVAQEIQTIIETSRI